jgi:hypothetical protein
MAPARFIFADLDALNQDVSTYMRAHATEFSDAELMKRSPISARRLTKLLSQPSGVATHFRGSYYYLKLKDVEAFRAAGWEVRPKSAAKNRTLGCLPKPTRYPEDDEEVPSKTLVLVAGRLTRSVLYGVDKYFEAGWCVQCYCFRDRDAKVYDRLASEHPKHFKRFDLDSAVKRLIKDISSNEVTYAAPSASPRAHAQHSTPSSHKLPGLYECIHELQEKVLAMEAKSAAQRIKELDDLHDQLQQQQEAFARRLVKQDENFRGRLQEQQEEHKRHEWLVEQRVDVCATEVAAALSSLGELSERVKQDIRAYERARLDEELAHWRHGTTQSAVRTTIVTRHDSAMNASLLEAIDLVLKQNGVDNGVANWRAALVMLVAHKVTAWSSTANYAADCIGILATFIAILAIASCFADAKSKH